MSRPPKPTYRVLAWLLGIIGGAGAWAESPERAPPLAERGICAHRGASRTHPENTLTGLREAVRLGAQMVEFDVQLSRDGELVLMHDRTVDRTTNGSGAVAELTFEQLRRLDAGSWKDPKHRGEQIPTFDETLAAMPENVWLNIHLKGDAALAEQTARRVVAHGRLHQAFLACGVKAAKAARTVDAHIKICNMDRGTTPDAYARATLDLPADFIQFLAAQPLNRDVIQSLQQRQVHINFCCATSVDQLPMLFDVGVQFVLVDDLEPMLVAAEKLGIKRLRPTFSASAR